MMDRTPEDVVTAQLVAYNAHDIDAYMACWAPDAVCFAYPTEVVARGHAEIRERYAARFAEPDLHAELLQRMVVEDVVIDRERVTRTFPEGVRIVEVIAIYRVEAGLIVEARFKLGAPQMPR